MQGGSLNVELLDAFPEKSERMTASAYEQAKGKLKSEVFEHILHEYNKTNENIALYENKYRLFAIDGSDFTTPYNPNSEYVVNNGGALKKNGDAAKAYCQVHANILYDIQNRTYEDCIFQPRLKMNERKAAVDMIKNLDCGEHIVVMDRGYESFNLIETCNRLENCFYVIRTKSGNGAILEIKNLPDEECDIDIEFHITTHHRTYVKLRDKENIHLINRPKKNLKMKMKDKRSIQIGNLKMIVLLNAEF